MKYEIKCSVSHSPTYKAKLILAPNECSMAKGYEQKCPLPDRIYNVNDIHPHKATENNEVQIEQLKPHFLVKNTTISKIKCTIEKCPKEKHTINKNTFL